MRKKTIVLSRRQVLHGAGGFTLGLPLLPSLVPVRAWAADVALPRQPAFVSMMTFNGGVLDSNWYPSDAALTESVDLVPGHTIRQGKLARTLEGTDAVLSKVLRAPASDLTDRLVGKMNIMAGLDMPFGLGHSAGGNLGNYYDSTTGPKGEIKVSPSPTVDMWLAWSPSFYRNLAGIRQRIATCACDLQGGGQGLSWYYADPQTKSGAIQKAEKQFDPVKLFNMLFSGGGGVPAAAPGRPPVVDRVMESYRLMRNGSRRLSVVDRQRLDDHMSRLAELQRSLAASSMTATGCKDLRAPATGPTQVANLQRHMDTIAAAFLCGYTRLANLAVGEFNFSSRKWDAPIWHNDITHNWAQPDAQALLVEAYRNVFANAFVYLLRKLDVEEAPGTTVLDNALVMWSQECSEVTHNQTSVQVLLAGGAAGKMRTGSYIDYRNRTPNAMARAYAGQVGQTYAGLTWNRLLATVLQAMGVPRSEYEKPGSYGFGDQYRDSSYVKKQAPGTWEQSGDFLPLLKA
jgi:hypothetical protein